MGSNVRRKLHCSLCLALVLFSCVWAESEVTVTHAKAGSTVTFKSKPPLNQYKQYDQMLWTFGASEPNIRIVKVVASGVELFAAQFESRLHVDGDTGDLTLSNLTVNDTGVYQQQTIGPFISKALFKLRVYNALSEPSVNIVTPRLGGCRGLLVECSCQNSPDLNLSWFRGKVRIKDTRSPDLARLSLTLEVGHSETSTYVCEAQNPVERRSKTLQPNELCLTNGESSSGCHSELTARLVLSAIIGLVLIVFVVDHLRIAK